MNSYSIKPRLTSTGKPKKGAGYDVYHVNQTRRVWIGHAPTKVAAAALRVSSRNGSQR